MLHWVSLPIVCEVKNKEPLNVNYDGNGTKLIEEYFFDLLDGIDNKTSQKRVQLP
jgi:hypothetical protein